MAPDPVIDLKEWLDCFEQATAELVAGSLRFEAVPVAPNGTVADVFPGAYIALLGDQDSMHLGISASPQGCRAIARGLLGIRSESELSDQDVMDGCRELINILAGKVKSKMVARDQSLRLGLPMFLVAQIQVTEGMEKTTTEVRLGPVECLLHVYRSPRAAAA